jgi:peroxiredoxin Q/BCP
MKMILLKVPAALSVSFLFLMSSASAIAQNAMPAVGAPAPAVSGLDQDGKTWKLADLKGKSAVLLYFYPKDDTPGCTKEACGFRDTMDVFKAGGVEVIGVSFDNAERHRAFMTKYELNFQLLADTDGKIADAFGVRSGNRSMARRVTFLIDKEGVIRHITDSPNAGQHLEEMKEAVGKLSQ